MEMKDIQSEEGQGTRPKRTVEENLALLEEMAAKLEKPETTLEESFRLYQEGMGILRDVSGTLELYEKKMKILTDSGETEDFT